MKTLVVYDSVYGNTEKIAQVIGSVLNGKVVSAKKVSSSELPMVNLLIVGSPVHGGRATPAIDELLKKLPAGSLEEVKVAAFDTRFAAEDHGIGIRILMTVIHYAAGRIAKVLIKKGGHLIIKPEGFIVENKEGPLKQGELNRARQWAKEVSKYE